MPSAPPRMAKTAAATGSGSCARRACRTVATWSMLTPSRTMVRRSCPRIAGHHLAIALQLPTQNLESEKRQQHVHDLVQNRQTKGENGNSGRQPEPTHQDTGKENEGSQKGGPGHVPPIERVEIHPHYGSQIVVGLE